jgi:hypothetical protein
VRPGLDGTPYLYTLNLSCPEVRGGCCHGACLGCREARAAARVLDCAGKHGQAPTARPRAHPKPLLPAAAPAAALAQRLWDVLSPRFGEAIASFRLVEPTRDYIAPDKDPWKFF